MFFARTARQVVCYEPNNTNRRRLLENIALNDLCNIQVRPLGIGTEVRSATMYYVPLMSGGASVDQLTVENLQKGTSVSQDIQITTLDSEVASGAPAPDFIKIDIEGYELEALKGARNTILRYGPDLFLEMHGETLREKKTKVRGIAKFLEAIHYHVVHVETGSIVRADNSDLAMEGHLFAKPAVRAENAAVTAG